MEKQLKAVILDDESVAIDGRTLVANDEIVAAITAALQRDPDIVVVIDPIKPGAYKAIGKVIYGSQRAGVPVANLRLTTPDGAVVTIGDLQAQPPLSGA